MSTVNASALLAAWEQGICQPLLQRALTLLATAWPATSPEDWAHNSIGQRDERLLTLREQLFGPALETVAVCPQCAQQLELSFSTQDIRTAAPALPASDPSLRVAAHGYDVQCRLPTSADLIEIARHALTADRSTLLQRCVQEVRCGDLVTDVALLPDAVVEAVIEEMAKADPQADVQVALTCPACRHQWSMSFDILSYLWSEIDDWAQRLLRDIHALASFYGWSEGEILALSARRRRLYLEMIGA
jgi:hypothetical protein